MTHFLKEEKKNTNNDKKSRTFEKMNIQIATS